MAVCQGMGSICDEAYAVDFGPSPEPGKTVTIGQDKLDLMLAKGGQVDDVGEPFERLFDGDARERSARHHRQWRMIARDDVAQPDIEWLCAEFARDEVDDSLAYERLGGPWPAVCDIARLVGDR